MTASMHPINTPTFRVSADLPGLPGVPAEVASVKCPGCSERAATVHHSCSGPSAELTATLICAGCGSIFDLLVSSDGYLTGLEVGVIVEAARRGDPRVVRS
jgi:hypothetical protein